jgi:hypothetical protein
VVHNYSKGINFENDNSNIVKIHIQSDDYIRGNDLAYERLTI